MSRFDALSVDVVSDVVCPWCFVGQKRLDRAMAMVPDIDVAVRWRPYQLDPTIPAQGVDRADYMRGKFGSLEKVAQMHERIVPLGAAEGIRFDFDAIKVSPNTLDAHRLIRWAGEQDAAIQNDVARLLFSLYFEQGRNVGDHAVLAGAAAQAGMDAAEVAGRLATDEDRDAVSAEIATAARMGITGVPCFLLEGRYAVMGAQDAENLAGALRQVAEAKARGELEPPAA